MKMFVRDSQIIQRITETVVSPPITGLAHAVRRRESRRRRRLKGGKLELVMAISSQKT